MKFLLPVILSVILLYVIPFAKTINGQVSNPLPAFSDRIHSLDGNLEISGNNPGTGSGVVFVDGDLYFIGDYCYGAANCLPETPPAGLVGAVFVVSGDIHIAPNVKRIDAVLISEGYIYTAANPAETCDTNQKTEESPGVPIQPLTINGSLISVKKPPNIDNPEAYIKFCRTLANNNQAAEKINHQPKYAVILRYLLSDTQERWSEIP